jgi:hypothetical protein
VSDNIGNGTAEAHPNYSLAYFAFNGESYDEIEECYFSIDSLFQRIRELWESHSSLKTDAGMSVILTNKSGAQLQVGVSQEGWLIALEPKKQFRLVRHPSDGGRHIPFLLPSWTEFPDDCIQTPDVAMSLVTDWLISNHLSLSARGLYIRE